jgi:branched-chain amino acid transport system substrate-binding protein
MAAMAARRWLAALALPAALVLAAAGCTGNGGGKAHQAAPIKIGFIADLSGIQKSNGISMRNGLQLYLSQHGHAFGGHPVQVVEQDQGDDPTNAKGVKAEQNLLEHQDLLAITGVSDVRTVVALQPTLNKRKLPLVISLACTTLPDMTYIWCASNLTSDTGSSLGTYVAQHVDGPVYVLGTDLGPAKVDTAGTFADTFTKAGGKIANTSGGPAYVPYVDTINYVPYLQEAVANGAKAIYVWATGLQAIRFIQAYQQLGLKKKGIQVYAAGPLTCCDLLRLEGTAALGMYSSLDYTQTLDNDANRQFVVAYQHAYGVAPNEPAEYGYSAASVLDQAITAAAHSGRPLTGEQVNHAIENLGIQNDPRGSWQFSAKHAPVQKFYLRQVRMDGSVLSNVLVDQLPTVGG